MTEQKKSYHNIFVPAPDIYLSEGDEPFESLQSDNPNEKNLLVVPQTFINDVNRNESISPSATEAFFRELRKYSGRQALAGNEAPVPAGGGLEVLIMRGEDGRDLGSVRDHLSSHYQQTSERSQEPEISGRVQIISDDDSKAIEYHGSGMYVGYSEFTSIDENIVRMGVREPDDYEPLLLALEQNHKTRSIPLDQAIDLMGEDLWINQFVRLRSDTRTQYAHVTGDISWNENDSHVSVTNRRLELLARDEYSRNIKINNTKPQDGNILGISPRNMEQYLAMQKGLLNSDVRVMFLTGDHGTGKTLLSYLSAMHQVLHWDSPLNKKFGYVSDRPGEKGARYQKAVLFKPPNEMRGRDIGYRPGSTEEKLRPHLMPFINAHNFRNEKLGIRTAFVESGVSFDELTVASSGVTNPDAKHKDSSTRKIQGAAHKPKHPVVYTPHIGDIRGINIPNSIVVVDETENLTPFEVKTLCGRVADDTKLIFLGDPFQVDNPRNSVKRNGLTAGIKHFYNKDYTMLLHLSDNQRSEISRDSLSMRAYQ